MLLLFGDVILAYFGWLLGSMVAILQQAMRRMDEQPAHWTWTAMVLEVTEIWLVLFFWPYLVSSY